MSQEILPPPDMSVNLLLPGVNLADRFLISPSYADPDPTQLQAVNYLGGPPKSAAVGDVDSELHGQVVQRCVDQYMHYTGLLTQPYTKMQEYWKLYLSKKKDRRKEHEKWRANVFVPYPLSGVETMVAAVTDILLSSDPPIQPEAIFEKEEKTAMPIQRLLQYTFTRNSWPTELDLLLRSLAVQGLTIPKLTWAKRSQQVFVQPWHKDIEDWKEAVREAEMRTGQKAPQEPAAFEKWRDLVNTAQYAKVPEMPIPGYKDIVEYEGPVITRDSIFTMRFDPFIERFQDQDCFIQRVVKPRTYIAKRTGPEAWKPFDFKAVEAGLGAYDGQRFTEWQREIQNMMGLEGSVEGDPRYQDACEILEVWRKDAEHPHLLILNRKAIINKPNSHGCYTMPYHHGQMPYFPIRNIPIEGHMLGISEIQPNEGLYKEMNALRDLRLDAVTLSVLPVFLKMSEAGLPELSHLLTPGMVLSAPRADAIQQLIKYQPNIMDAFREIMEIKGDIDETNATPPALRGGASNVGRVSATESERRFNQALLRQKQRVLRIEEELSPAVRMAQMLWLQFGSHKTRVRIAGDDPYLHISRQQLLESLDMDFRFRGASKALNRDLAAQQLMAFAEKFAQWLIPTETRALMRRVYENLGQRGVAEIVSQDGTDFYTAMQQMQQAQQQAMAAGGGQPGPGGPGGPSAPGGPGAPAGAPPAAPPVEGEAAQAVVDASGGAQ